MADKTTKKKKLPTVLLSEVDRRGRFANLKVLVADRNHRTASLLQRLLASFGFRNMDVTTSGESALTLLKNHRYDLLITEWNMAPVNGVELVKTIRGAKDDKRLARDIPILMLTAQADVNSVYLARDAGITEFVAKPFSAKTISGRIIQIIDNPRSFVDAGDYVGPCRRRRGAPPPGMADRRIRTAKLEPGNDAIKQQIGANAADILTDLVVVEAQTELLKAENEFVDWAREDIALLEHAYAALKLRNDDKEAYQSLLNTAYTIKSQAGIFGYTLGTEVAALLVDYLSTHDSFTQDRLIVLRKFIDAISIIFKQQIKESGQGIAVEMITSLKKLTQKLG